MKALHKRVAELKHRAKAINYTQYDIEGATLDLRLTTENNTIKGYLSVWGVRDSYGTIMLKGCCTKSINERGPKSSSKSKIAFLWQHRMDEPLGQFTTLIEDSYGLYFESECDDVPTAQRALTQIKSGTLNQFSIGFLYLWDKTDYDEKLDAVVLHEIDLYEGSIVTIGSNAETYVVRSAEQYIEMIDSYQQDIEVFIRTIPRRQQLELRELLNRHESLLNIKPENIPLSKIKEPNSGDGKCFGYKINFN